MSQYPNLPSNEPLVAGQYTQSYPTQANQMDAGPVGQIQVSANETVDNEKNQPEKDENTVSEAQITKL